MIVLLALLGCDPATVALDTAPDDTDTGTHTDSDTDTAVDTDTDTDTAAPVAIEALAVSVHPEIATLLVASWTQLLPGDTWLSWTLDGETFTSPVRSREAGPASEVVLGVPADTDVPLTLHVSSDGVEALYDAGIARTGALPGTLVLPTLTLASPGMDDAPYFLTSVNVGAQNFFGPCVVVLLDRQGRVVWYRTPADSRLTLFPRVSQSGTHIVWDATAYYVPGTPSITRATLSLSQEVATEIPSMGFTWSELPDGSFLYDEAETPYDYHLTRRHPDGTDQRIWSCAPWMAPHSVDYWACAANTALWNEAEGVVTWSMFQTSTVLGIDLETGAIRWELGEYPGGLAISPADVRLELQHYPSFTPDGTLLLTTHLPDAREQHIREFRVDGDTATQVWDYTAATGYYGDYAGEATRLPNGNTLINFGTDGVVQEVTPDRAVVWELDWADRLVGHLTPVYDLYALDEGW